RLSLPLYPETYTAIVHRYYKRLVVDFDFSIDGLVEFHIICILQLSSEKMCLTMPTRISFYFPSCRLSTGLTVMLSCFRGAQPCFDSSCPPNRLFIFGRNSLKTIGFFAHAEAPAEIAFFIVVGPYAVMASIGIEDVSCTSFSLRVNSTPFSLGMLMSVMIRSG